MNPMNAEMYKILYDAYVNKKNAVIAAKQITQ